MAMLEQSWSTEHLQPGKALTYWRDVICENLLQMHIQSGQESAFFGRIEKHAFGPIKANFISVSEQRVWRDRATACTAKDHTFHLIHVRKGVQLIEQYGRSLKVEAGDCLLIDCLAGFEFDFPQGVEALVLEIGRDWLSGWLPSVSPSGLRTRRRELVDAGEVIDTGRREQLSSGRWATVWGLPGSKPVCRAADGDTGCGLDLKNAVSSATMLEGRCLIHGWQTIPL